MILKRIVDVAARKAYARFKENAIQQLVQIFPSVEKDFELKTKNVPSMLVDIIATSANGRHLIFEIKHVYPEQSLGYSALPSVAALKDAVEEISPQTPPIVTILTNSPISDSVRIFFAQHGIPAVVLTTHVPETKADFQKAFEQCAIAIPELGAKPKENNIGLEVAAGQEELSKIFADFLDNAAKLTQQQELLMIALRHWENLKLQRRPPWFYAPLLNAYLREAFESGKSEAEAIEFLDNAFEEEKSEVLEDLKRVLASKEASPNPF